CHERVDVVAAKRSTRADILLTTYLCSACDARFAVCLRQPRSQHFAFENVHYGVIVKPGIRVQPSLHANLIQEASAVPLMIDGHARQKQAVLAAARDLDAVLADRNSADTVLSLRRDRLRFAQEPDLHVEMLDFARRQRRETRVLEDGARGCFLKRVLERDRRPQHAAAGTQMFAALEADEYAGH